MSLPEILAAQQAAADAIVELKKRHTGDFAMDVIREIALGYLFWEVMEHGREGMDRLLRERLNSTLVRRSEKKLELVVSNTAERVA